MIPIEWECQIGIEISDYLGNKISVGVARPPILGNQYHEMDDIASQEQGYNACVPNQG